MRRAILPLQENSKINNPKFNIDSIEMNSHMVEFEVYIDDVEMYSDLFIQIGLVTIFAAAQPLGPIIAILMNIFEIRFRISAHLNVF